MTAKATDARAQGIRHRLYFITIWRSRCARVARSGSNPVGGAAVEQRPRKNAILDTQGRDPRRTGHCIMIPSRSIDAGIMMGFHQNADGALSWGYGQHDAKNDALGRKVFNRRLPPNYADFSHAMMPAENGGYFLRVASPDLRAPRQARARP